MVKNLQVQEWPETWVQFLGGEEPLGEKRHPTPVFLPGKCHGQRRLEGDSPWGSTESGHLCVPCCFTAMAQVQFVVGEVRSPKAEPHTHTHTPANVALNRIESNFLN